MNALVPITNAEVYRASTDAAGLCREIVLKTAQNIQGRKYVKVEGWQAIAIAHGCVASADEVQRVNDEGMGGFKAIGTVRRMSDGAEISRAEGFIGDDETMWAKRPVYARRAMVQTRAISRACRSAFAHVVVLIDANLSTTPAEEVPMGGFDDHHHQEPANAPRPPRSPMRDVTPRDEREGLPAPSDAPLDKRGKPILPDEFGRYNANQCKTITTARPDNGEVLTKFDLGGKLHHEMTDVMEVTELLAWKTLWENEIKTWPLSWSDRLWAMYDEHLEDLRRLAATPEEGDDWESDPFRASDEGSVSGDDRRAAA